MNNTIVVGCDIGGSHISTALVDLKHRTIIANSFVRQTVDSSRDAVAVICSWSDCIQASLKTSHVSANAIGIAIPGPFDYQEGISLMKNQDKYEQLYGVNVRLLLAERLGVPAGHIYFINDAAAFLEGEMFAGAGKIFKKAVGLTLGTGLGSALFLNGHAEDGDLWHTPFREGIAEDYLSGRWLKHRYLEKSGQAVEHVKAIAERVPGDGIAKAVFEEFGKTLGEFIVKHLLQKDPECVVIGGNIAKANALFLNSTYNELAEYGSSLPIKTAELGEMAAIYGAASVLK